MGDIGAAKRTAARNENLRRTEGDAYPTPESYNFLKLRQTEFDRIHGRKLF
jgi:hypothetical protein